MSVVINRDFPTEVLQKEEGPVTFLPNVASDGGGSSLHSSAHSLEDSFELRCKVGGAGVRGSRIELTKVIKVLFRLVIGIQHL